MTTIVVHFIDDSCLVTVAAQGVFSEYLSHLRTTAPKGTTVEIDNFEVNTFLSGTDWLRRTSETVPQIVVLDLSRDGDDEAGFKLAPLVREQYPDCAIVMFSGFDDADTVLRFKGAGADGFISKKTDLLNVPEECMQIYRILQRRRLSFQALPALEGKYAGATLTSIVRRVPQILNSAIRTVHVSGETGTGKEVVADIFEACLRSQSATKPFIKVNCGGIMPSLLESELFGHAKGAFTGALVARKGILESAHGGWVFLDEVASLSLAAQVALLRVIENQEVTPVGEVKPKRIDVRVISACNED